MRISTARFYQTSIESIHNQQEKLVRLQQQLATGKRVLNPSDDPAAASRALALDKISDEYKQYSRNADFAEAKLSIEENAIASTQDILQRIRELAVFSASQLNTEAERAGVASEVEQLFKQVVDIANYRDGNNEYIFGGFQSKVKPFTPDAAGVINYNGDQGERDLNISPDVKIKVNDAGSDVFQAIRNGNGTFYAEAAGANTGTGIIGEGSVSGTFVSDTYSIAFTQAVSTDPITYTITGATSGVVATGTYATAAQLSANEELSTAFNFNGVQVDISGTPADGDTFTVAPSQNQSVFDTVQGFIDALRLTGDSVQQKTRVSNGVNRSLTDLNQAMENFMRVRTDLGARRNTVENRKLLNEDLDLEMATIRSNLMDLDFSKAVSDLNQELTSLQAAQSTFVRVQNLSIFNFLN